MLSHQFWIGFGIGVEMVAMSVGAVALVIYAHRKYAQPTK